MGSTATDPTEAGSRTDRPRLAIRAASDRDLEQVHAIIRQYYGGLEDWPERPDYLDHERATGRMLVALDDEDVIGFGATIPRDAITHLGDLFIKPQRLGQGVGQALLGELFLQEGVRTTSASDDPRALPLYVRFGMRPLWPVLYMRGDQSAARRLPDAEVALVEAQLATIVELDAQVSMRRRPEDIEFLARSDTTFFTAAGLSGAYGGIRTIAAGERRAAYVRPVGAASSTDAARFLPALVRRAADQADLIHVPPLGPHPAVPALLAAGFRVQDRDTFMCSDPALLDPARYVPSPEVG